MMALSDLQALAGAATFYMRELADWAKRLLWGPLITGYACPVRPDGPFVCSGCNCPKGHPGAI